MTVGRVEGDRCGRANHDWAQGGKRTVCAGQIIPLGSGQDAAGVGYRFVGCERGCWSVKETLPEPDTIPLFGGTA